MMASMILKGMRRLAVGLMSLHAVLVAQQPDDPLKVEMEAALPPFVVNGYLIRDDTWKYGTIEGFEVLSECSVRQTREVVAALWRGRQLALPPQMRPQSDLPMVVVLFDNARLRSAPNSLGFEQHPGETSHHWTNVIKRTSIDRESFAINLSSLGFDYSPVFRFDLITLLQRRTPRVPRWLNEGLFGGYGIYREGIELDGADKQKGVRPSSWYSRSQLLRIAKTHLRAGGGKDFPKPREWRSRKSEYFDWIQPLQELFERAPPGEAVGADRWRSTAALFARWAIYANQAKEGEFWSFAEMACREPITEAKFKKYFDMSYEEANSVLSWYVVSALTEPEYAPANLEPMPWLSMRSAKGAEVARVLGDWERIEADAIEKTAPELARNYRKHALEKLQAYSTKGAREPRLIESLGMLFLAIGEPASAREQLEACVTADVAGPRPYLELAKLRLASLQASSPTEAEEKILEDVTALLLRAESKKPALRETYSMLAALDLDRVSLRAAQITALRRGKEFFPQDSDLREEIDRALLQK